MITNQGDELRMFVSEAGTLEIYGSDETDSASFCLYPGTDGYTPQNRLCSVGDCSLPEEWDHRYQPKYELSEIEMKELFHVIRDWIKEAREDEM